MKAVAMIIGVVNHDRRLSSSSPLVGPMLKQIAAL
jgi:hypothetical protein